MQKILVVENSAPISNSNSICWTQIHLKTEVDLRHLSKPISKRNLTQSDNQLQLKLKIYTLHKADQSHPIVIKSLK